MRILFQNAPHFITYRKFIFLYLKGKIFNHFSGDARGSAGSEMQAQTRQSPHKKAVLVGKQQCQYKRRELQHCQRGSTKQPSRPSPQPFESSAHGTAQRRPSSHQQFSTANGRIPHFSDEFESNGILPVGSVTHHHLDAQVTTYFDSL